MSQRENNGTFAAGNRLSPGRPPSVFASQNDVADRLLQKYAPSEIIAIAGDPVRLDKECSSFQAMILIQLANALSARDNNDNALERERLLDRVVGKPMQRVEQKISVSVETEAALLEGRRRVAKSRGVELPAVNYSVLDASAAPDAILLDAPAAPELSAAEKLEARRKAAREYSREYGRRKAAERKASGVKVPSFNDRLAAKDKTPL